MSEHDDPPSKYDFSGCKTVTDGSPLIMIPSLEDYRYSQILAELTKLRQEVALLRQQIEKGENDETRGSSPDNPQGIRSS